MDSLMIADRDLYWNADKRIVLEESSPHQAWVCIHKGAQVTDEWLALTGCKFKDGKLVLPGGEAEAEPEKKRGKK